MKTTIIIGHPYKKSFNYSILDTVLQSNPSATVINLIEDQFNPTMLSDDLALFSKGHYADPLVGKYQQILNSTEKLIIISPIWWYGFPAIIKGFFDKVMLKNFAYTEENNRLVGKLLHIKETKIITTGSAPAWYIKFFGGNPIGALKRRVFKDMGIKNVQWFHKGNVTKSPENNKNWLVSLTNKI
ncbi:NAD(P)H-dependent oxidoreductase [Enterococcus faecalis]|uniref:NAD(P)H-dependent oxidoreductase n=1 Tax=Enterococcus TaxID=1350 RepID=UPI003A90ADCF